MKKIFYLLLLLFAISTIQVKAKNYEGTIYLDDYIIGDYLKLIKPGQAPQYTTAQFIRRSTDNAIVYCLEPFILVDSSSTYEIYTSGIVDKLQISQESWNRIQAISYFGYGYHDDTHNHQESKWYSIAQLLIWQTVDPNSEFYFTKTLNGDRDSTKYSKEIQEIEDLITKFNQLPDITLPKYLIKNQTITVSDPLLNEFRISYTNNTKASINGNTLSITPTSDGHNSFSIKRKSIYNNKPTLYYSSNSQKVISQGTPSYAYKEFSYEVITPSLTIIKTSQTTNTPLANAIYGIYDSTDKYITSITTNQNGEATFNNFPSFGKYYLLEEQAPLGYALDLEKHYFNIADNHYKISLSFTDELITGQIKIIKLSTSNYSVENAVYGLYNQEHSLIEYLTIDSSGTALSSLLPYGNYYIQEVSAPEGYLLDPKTYSVSITNPDEIVIINSTEPLITGHLKIIKVDEETLKPLKGVIFSIYDELDNLIATAETNEEGLIILRDLPYGKYYIIEEETLPDYAIDCREYMVIINENQALVEIIISNKLIPKDPPTPEIPEINLVPDPNTEEPPIEDDTIIVSIPDTLSSINPLLFLGAALIIYEQKKNH